VVKVHSHLYVGADADYTKLVARMPSGWSVVRPCKFGSGGHKDILGYSTQAAPKGPHYLWAKFPGTASHLALNLVDLADHNYIAPEMIDKALEFIHDRIEHHDNVLIACNHGRSRAPTIAMMYLRMIGDLPSGFMQSERIFHAIYPDYDPAQGIRQFARSNWSRLRQHDPTNPVADSGTTSA
jgi:hypothetical protein